MSRRRAGLSLAALGVAALGVAALTIAMVIVLTPSSVAGRRSAAVPVVSAGTLPSSSAPGTQTRGVPVDAAPPGPRATLRLQRLDLDARVVHVRLDGSVMQVPRDPARVGWWSGGAAPGAAHGSAVLVGHVNYAGRTGTFASLPKLRPGDVLTLSQPATRFRVDAIRSYPKTTGLPQSIFRRDGAPQLVLITCGGDFDGATGNYRDNIVVYATPARNG